MTLSTPPDSTDKTCVEDYKLKFFAEEHVRAKALRVDTMFLRGIIHDQQDVIDLQRETINDKNEIILNKDSANAFVKRAYNQEVYNHNKTKKQLKTATVIEKVLAAAVLILGATLIFK